MKAFFYRAFNRALEELFASSLAVVVIGSVFVAGWFARELHDERTAAGALRAAQLRCLHAQAKHFEQLAKLQTVVVPGPEVFTPADDESQGEPTPADPSREPTLDAPE